MKKGKWGKFKNGKGQEGAKDNNTIIGEIYTKQNGENRQNRREIKNVKNNQIAKIELYMGPNLRRRRVSKNGLILRRP